MTCAIETRALTKRYGRPTSGDAIVLGLSPRAGGAPLRRRIGFLPGELLLERRVTGRALRTHYAAISGPVPRGGLTNLPNESDST